MNQTTQLQPASRTSLFGFSDIVKIRNRVLALRQQGASVLQLEGGEPFAPTPEFVREAMKKALDENQTRYAPSSGITTLLEAISLKLGERNRIRATPDQLVVVAGGMHGLFCAFQATLDPGDETIFFSPFWTPIRDLVQFCGATPVVIPWTEVRGSDPTEALRRRITPRTRVIYVNSPANPTGDLLGEDAMRAIAKIAIENDLVVIADEAYEDITYGQPPVAIASLPGMSARTITVFTLSKSFSMTGCRIGYVVAEAPFIGEIRKLVLNSVNGVSTPTQFGAAAAISDRSDYLERMRGEYRLRRDLLVEGLRSAGFPVLAPAGAFYLLVDVRERLGGDSFAAMSTLLDRTSIATVPGVVFGQEGEGFLRMSFSNPVETLEKAVAALEKL